MVKKFIHKSMYSKFLLSYIALLILPIVIITSIMSGIIFNILETVISQKDETALMLSTSKLKNEISSCYKISEMLNSIDGVKPFNYSENVYEAITLINTLGKYKATNSSFEKVFINFYGYDYVYSDTTAYKMESFLNMYSKDSESKSDLKSAFTDLKSPRIIYEKNTNKNFYTIPYIVNSEIIGTVGFILDNKNISNLISIASPEKNILLIDSMGNYANFNNEINIVDNDVLSLIDKYSDEISKNDYIFKSTDTDRLFISKLQSYKLYFLYMNSNDVLFKDLNNVRFILFIAIFATFSLGLVIIYFLLQANYKPILQLKNISKKMYKDNNDNYSYNEVEYIKSTLIYLNDRNTELEYKLYENLPIRQNFLLNKLINGEVFEEKEFLLKCNEINLSLTAPYHIIITVKSKNKSLSLLTLLEKNNMQILSSEYEYIINSDISGQTIYLIGLKDNTLNYQRKYEFADETIVSFGTIHSTLTHLTKSYIASRNNLDFDKAEIYNKSMQLLIDKYALSLKTIRKSASSEGIKGDFSQLNFVIQQINKENLPFNIIRNIYFEIVIVINSILERNKHLINYTNIELASLFEIETKETFNEILLEPINEILEIIENIDENSVPRLSVNEIKLCIDTNYTDYSFSLQLVADKFNVSLSYLSQFFKEKTGSTVLEYITNLKMNRAKELLISTSLPLKDVAEQIGYVNVSSFIRRFKQVTGMTPGEYKKMTK